MRGFFFFGVSFLAANVRARFFVELLNHSQRINLNGGNQMATAAKTVEKAASVPLGAIKKMFTVQGVSLLLIALVGNIVHAQMKKRVAWYRNLAS